MLGDSGAAHLKRRRQLLHRSRTQREPLQDGAAGGVGQGRKREAEGIRVRGHRNLSLTYRLFNLLVIYTSVESLSSDAEILRPGHPRRMLPRLMLPGQTQSREMLTAPAIAPE